MMLFFGSGTKLILTGDENDVIFLDKLAKIDGHINAKNGTNTLSLVSSSFHGNNINFSLHTRITHDGSLTVVETPDSGEVTVLHRYTNVD